MFTDLVLLAFFSVLATAFCVTRYVKKKHENNLFLSIFFAMIFVFVTMISASHEFSSKIEIAVKAVPANTQVLVLRIPMNNSSKKFQLPQKKYPLQTEDIPNLDSRYNSSHELSF